MCKFSEFSPKFQKFSGIPAENLAHNNCREFPNILEREFLVALTYPCTIVTPILCLFCKVLQVSLETSEEIESLEFITTHQQMWSYAPGDNFADSSPWPAVPEALIVVMLPHDMIAVTAETNIAISLLSCCYLLKPQLIDERIILEQVDGHIKVALVTKITAATKNKRSFGNVLF